MRKLFLFLLILPILSGCKTPPSPPPPLPEVEVMEPNFEIVSIIIIQADLINTQFEATLKIDNPNVFPVEISSLTYELYGNGMFWADGTGVDLLQIDAESSRETNFRFSMNFINMNRNLLDDVIAMRQVQYRFKGEVTVKGIVPRAQIFTMGYDISGLSGVKPTVND